MRSKQFTSWFALGERVLFANELVFFPRRRQLAEGSLSSPSTDELSLCSVFFCCRRTLVYSIFIVLLVHPGRGERDLRARILSVGRGLGIDTSREMEENRERENSPHRSLSLSFVLPSSEQEIYIERGTVYPPSRSLHKRTF